MKENNIDKFEDTIYGLNSYQQSKIWNLLHFLNIKPRNLQNINFITIKVDISYFPKENKGADK